METIVTLLYIQSYIKHDKIRYWLADLSAYGEKREDKMKVMYDGVLTIAVVNEDGVFVFDDACNCYVRLGSLEQCETEFADLN